MIKRQIISLYEEDFKKIDDSGRISAEELVELAVDASRNFK